ncbi:MAG: SDR family oxidoreductase [Chloroflexi bacterium]|nr:SDR family oxidoreductase [Chloroflexota bacterium]
MSMTNVLEPVLRANYFDLCGYAVSIRGQMNEFVARLQNPPAWIGIINAASGFNRPVMEQRPKGWDWSMNINARALLFAAQRAVPLMEARGGGSIVGITSPGSTRVLPDYVSVGTSKAALESLIRYLAVELASKNIVVNAVSPGIVLTEALQHFDALREDEDMIERAGKLTPAGRIATPEAIAGVVAFLCTPAAERIRGQVIVVDGRYTLPVPGVAH